MRRKISWVGAAGLFCVLLLPDAAYPEPGQSVRIELELDAPIEEVWDAWREAELIERWWGPEGFDASNVEVHFEEGEATLVCMQGQGTPLVCNTWTYTEISEPDVIAFDSRFSDSTGTELDPSSLGLPPGIPAVVPHRITFRTLGSGRTEMIVLESGYMSAEAADLSKRGLEQVLRKFEDIVE